MMKIFYPFAILISSLFLSFGHLPLPADEESNSPQVTDPSFSNCQGDNSPIAMANIDAEPSTLIHGCVNVITGHYSFSEVDLVVPHGVDPLKLERHFNGVAYGNGSLCPGWFVSHVSLVRSGGKDDDGDHVILLDNGAELQFKEQSSSDLERIAAKSIQKGVTNNASGYISGQTNIKNLTFTTSSSARTLTMGNGSKKTYDYINKDQLPHRRIMQEVFPSGNVVKFGYDHKKYKTHLLTATLYNSKNQKQGCIKYPQSMFKSTEEGHEFKVTASTGQWAKYCLKYEPDLLMNVVTHAETSESPPEKYLYHFYTGQAGQRAYMTHRLKPDGRYLNIEYFWRGPNKVPGGSMNIEDELDPRLDRVRRLMAPIGTTHDRLPMYQFVYDLNIEKHKKRSRKRNILNGNCVVTDSLGHKVKYHFNDLHRLTEVIRHDTNGQIYTIENMQWADENSKDNTNLLAHSLEHVGHGHIFSRIYQYDTFGNVIKNDLYGDLSGHSSAKPEQPKNGKATPNGSECYTKTFTYSQDGYNLLLEETDGTQTTAYRYAPESNRMIAKFQGSPQKWHQRHFFTYNIDAGITLEIVDDGPAEDSTDLTDVTERHLTYFTHSTNGIHAAMPISIEKKCLDLATGEELLVHKVVNTYNETGKITRQEHYDANNEFAYSLSWVYNGRGSLIEEIDRLGRVTTRRYDANKNCIEEKGHNTDVYKTFSYDYMNRLINETEIHTDGINRTMSYKYDTAGRRTHTYDADAHHTNFSYDPHGRVTMIKYPRAYDANMDVARPIIRKSYDPMGNVISETDPSGIKTTRRYTLRGQLAEAHYPDGSSEQKTYSLEGFLVEHLSRNGIKTTYQNDYAGRPLKAITYDTHGKEMARTTATYSGFHILTETDSMGTTTYYSYYPDGKLKSQRTEDNFKEYIYDALGRKSKTIEYYGPNPNDCIVKAQDHDIADRVIEERVEDFLGNIKSRITYTYDISDHVTSITTYPNNVPSTTTTEYDSHGVPRVITDAMGNQTRTIVKYDVQNSLGQYIPHTEITDPEGNITITEQDALGRNTLSMRKNAFGKNLQKQECFYDSCGNCTRIVDTIYVDGIETAQIATIMEYDSCHRLIATYEAEGTPEQKQTKITYNNLGQKENVIKGDGTTIHHTYDERGRLSTIASSDGTVNYRYEYDRNNNPIKAHDLVHRTATNKVYDANSRLIEEILGNGLKMAYTYDGMGRPLKITLPDSTGIGYEYDTCYMKAVSRIDAKNNTLYAHTYKGFDLSGKLTGANLIGQAGDVAFEYDILGRNTLVKTKHWSEAIVKYDRVGNIVETRFNEGKANASPKITSSQYSYDDLYQITQEEGASDQSYLYDSHYNRLAKNGVSSQFNPLHQLLEDGKFSYSYDLNGNLIKKESLLTHEVFTYTYDAFDRMIAFQNSDTKAVYMYDETNRRLSKELFAKNSVGKWISTELNKYIYNGENEIGACNKDGKTTELRLLGLGRGAEIGAAIAIEVEGHVYAPLHDHAGSVACLIDANDGSLAGTYTYTAYGEELFEDAPIAWRFSSKRVDEETGFINFGRRYYSPETGRWVTPDPIGREGGPNLYAYVMNNPLTHIDLYGLMGQPDYSDYWQSSRTGLSYYLDTAWRVPGRVIELIGRHLSPLPAVQSIIEFAGYCLRGGNPTSYTPYHNHDQVGMMVRQGLNNHKNVRILFINGILNRHKDANIEMENLDTMYDGETVYAMKIPSQGFLLDIREIVFQKLGFQTERQRIVHQEIHKLVDDMGEDKHHGMLLVQAHSGGCEFVHHMCSSIKKMMYVDTYGPARVLNPSEYLGVRNHVNLTDPVPYIADPIGCVIGFFMQSIVLAIPRGFITASHDFSGPTYSDWRNSNAQFHKQQLCW